MKTSALFQNTISSFFLKRARTVKYCAVFAVYVLCAIGAWGTEYTWTGGGTDSNWTTENNWDISGYPGTGDTAIFTGNTEVTAVLDGNITISTIKTGTEGASKVTIDTNGYTLTTDNFYLTEEYASSGKKDTNTEITGGGSVETKTFDFPNKHTHNVTIGSGTTLKISETLYGNADNDETLTFKGSGTLYLPASGANVDYGESKITYDRSTGLKVLPWGNPTYYKVTATGLDDFPSNNITITITRASTSNERETVYYPYTFKTTNSGGGTFSFNGQDGDSNGRLSIETTATDKKAEFNLEYSETENLAAGDGFTLTVRTPDDSMELAVISYYKDKPRWTGAVNSDWNTPGNWTGITNISEITSTSEITINSGVSNYPKISTNVSLKSLTITSNAKVTMTGGTLTVDKLICTGNSNFTATGGTAVFGNSETDAEFSADYPDNSSFCNVEVTAGKNFTSSNSMTVTGNFTSNGNTTLSSGTLTVSGTATVSSGAEINVNDADFSGTVTNNGEIICGGGDVTFRGNVTNDGKISGSSGEITFSGTYGSSTATEATPAILKASSGSTYFYSAANFSYTTFAANNGTVFFNSSNAAGKTLTTNTNGQAFNNVTLQDTGNSALTVNGTLNINGTLTTGTNRTLDMQTNNSALNVVGTTDNSGEIKLGSQPAQFTGAVTNSGRITASDGAVTFGETTNSGGITCSTTTTVFNGAVTVSAGGTITGTEGTVTFGGNVTNDGEINGSSGEITFSGTYGSSTATETTPAKLTASSGNTYFSSDADFSYTTFTANGGIVLFSSTATTGQKLTLPNNTVSFNEITIQTSAGGFTAEGTENGNLSAKKLTLASTNAGAVFNVPVTAETIENTGGSFNITFNAATTVTNPVTFGTTGTLTLGNYTTDKFIFAGGMTHTQGNTTLCGKIITNSAEVTLSDNTNIKTLTLTGNSAVQTTGADGTGSGAAITLGSVSGMGKALTLTGGTGNITVYGAVGTESAKLGNIAITGNAVTLQKPAVTQGTFTVTNSGSFTIAEAANITADGGFTQAGTGTLAIGGTSITTKNAPISFNGSGRLTINGDILLISSSDTANGGDITIKTPVEPAGNPAPSLTLSAGKGKINFNSDTGTTNRIKDVSVQSASEVEFTNKLNANKISVTTEKITLTQNAQLDTAETAVFSNSGILLLEPSCSINSAGTIEQNGNGKNKIAGTITAQEIILKNNTYIYNKTEIKAEKFTVGSDTTPADLADLYISALEGGSPAQVTFNAETHIFGNYALFNGNVTQNENLSVEKDIILLNGNAAAMYKDANDGSSSSSVADLFKYTGRNGSVIAENSLSAFPDKMPDGTTINHSGKYTSTFSILPGITISAKQNFYDNGTDLSPGGSWTLKLKPNDRAKDAFAELYNAKIAHCKVSPIGGGTAFLSAAENGPDADVGNNDRVFFSRPKILVHNAANAKDTDGNANLSGTYTVYDNVIRVEFVDSLTKQPLKIENSCNEISAALSTIEFGGTSQKTFEGAYTTAECTQSTDEQGDLSVFFLKTADSDKWNTDATGISKGADESTDWNGTHRTAIPYLNIPKALDSVWQTLRDEHKNRIAHYYTQTPLLSSENGTSGATFTAVPDLCAPVLVAVRTGQELHAKNDGTAESQPFYDSHNFIELQYSEPVNTGSILLTSTEEETVQNTQVKDDFGKIEGTSGNGLTVSGLIKTASGMLKTGSNGTEDNLVHSLYRKFSVTAGAENSFNTNRLRISIAGYVDKTVSTARGSFKHWKGYIDSAETPSGTVTRLYSPLITDKYGNTIEATGTDAHKLPGLSVISEQSELYGKWDTHAPVFAAYKNITNDEDNGFEAIGTSNVDGTTLDRIEFHVFDNETNEPDWYIRTGWCNSSKSLFTPFSYAADIFGGARPFSTDKKVRTSGGLRYASLYDKSSSFSYKIDSGNPTAFSTDEITGGAKGLVFRTQSDVTNATGGEDGLYFSVYLADFSIPLKTTFEVTYNENGFVTDLAGNRMKTETITTIDRTPPAFNMSIGAVPDDSGNSYEELYVIFNKKLNTNSVIVYNNDGTTETKQFSEALRESLRFIDSSTKSPAQDISISTEKEVTVVFQNEYFTGLKIPLNRSLTYGNIKNLWIQAFTEKTSVDPLSGVEYANVTYIQDTLGNYLPHKSAHAISDFAVNVVNPIYAYDTQTTEDGAFFSQQMYQDGSWAVHDWNAEQKNYGTLSAGYDLFIEANLSDGSGEAPEDTTVFAYFDTMPDTQALSVTYNENISGTGLSSWRVWLPNYITHSSGTQERSPVFKALSPQNNAMSKQTVLSGIKGEVPADAKTTGEIQFSLNSTSMENAGWKSGDQISFLFALSDGSNNPVKICHAPEYDSLTNTYTTEESPLFALRLKNSGDLTSADLWSFKLQSITKQRGGVTIFNNVINAANGEKTVVQVNMPSGGTLNVIVMTLDGNIVKYLQHGEASQGEHNYTWDGTTKSGKKVARGLYFIRVFGNGIDETRKVMVVK